jgi:hypothetical protein
MKKLTLNKVAMWALIVAVITNPVSGAYILWGLDYGFGLVFRYASPVNFVALGVVAGYILWKMWESRDVTNIPKKTAKTKTQKYVEV